MHPSVCTHSDYPTRIGRFGTGIALQLSHRDYHIANVALKPSYHDCHIATDASRIAMVASISSHSRPFSSICTSLSSNLHHRIARPPGPPYSRAASLSLPPLSFTSTLPPPAFSLRSGGSFLALSPCDDCVPAPVLPGILPRFSGKNVLSFATASLDACSWQVVAMPPLLEGVVVNITLLMFP